MIDNLDIEILTKTLDDLPNGVGIFQVPDLNDIKSIRYVFMNKVVLYEMRKKQEEVLGKRIIEVAPEAFEHEAGLFVMETYRKVAKEGGSVSLGLVEYSNHMVAGTYECSVHHIKDNYVYVMLRNVTELEQTKNELEFHKERLELAIKGSNGGILDWININADQQWWSPAFYEMLGYQDREIQASMSNFMNKLLYSKDRTITQNEIQKCIQENKPFDVAFRLKTKSNHYIWCRGRGSLINKKDGNPPRMTGTVTDIDQQKKLEIELKETRGFLKKITDIAPSIIYVFNQETMSNEYANKELGRVLGYSIKEIQQLGADLMPTLCHPDDLNRVFGHFQTVANLKNKEVASIEYRMKHKDGAYRWLLSEDTTFERNKEGKLIKQLGVATDITKLKEAQGKLSKQTQELQSQNEDLKQFAYVATHDLKNPILTVEGHFNYIKESLNQPSEEITDSFEFIDEELENFNSTLKGLNDAIKIREVATKQISIDFNKMLKSILPPYQKKVNELDGELQLELVKDIKVKGTEVFVKSILQNLISNAIKYRSLDKPPVISIKTETNNQMLSITIQDNGLGIDLERQKDKVFKMFNRFHRHQEGNGMGLYMVKQMVEKLDGRINIESKVNLGTTFNVKLNIY